MSEQEMKDEIAFLRLRNRELENRWREVPFDAMHYFAGRRTLTSAVMLRHLRKVRRFTSQYDEDGQPVH